MTALYSKTRLRPIIRVFVSSTFSDMKQERNALQEHVFPKLEQLCLQSGFQFQAIDLRWGVSSEAGLDHRTMRICFDELRRAQEISPEPNFLVLLGNRYGWRPLPEEISQVEFDKFTATANSSGDNQLSISGTHGKTARQVLCEWYRCDENVVLPIPPETSPDRAPLNYILQPRTQDLSDGRDYTRRKDDPTKDTQDWIEVQQVLWRIINAAFPTEALDRRFDMDWAQHVADVNDWQHPKRAIPQIARFQASATEQEIWCGALSAANAERHVIACFREIANWDEFAPADLNDVFDVNGGKFDAASVTRQSDLKAAIQHRLGDNAIVPIPFFRLKRENSKVVVDASEVTIKKFCDDVFKKLRPIIERQIEEYWHKSTPASSERAARELKIEQDEHERFGRERGGANSFVGRQTQLQAILDHVQNDSPWPLVIHGASGCGKTALMWRAFEEVPETRKPIIRLIGTTPHSSDVRSLLGSLCQELRLRHPREGELPADTKALREELHEQFRAATPEQPLIMFLDALDQLSDADGGRLLNWIPTGPLPGHVKLVVSCLSDRAKDDPAGQPCAELMRRQLPAENFINLDAFSKFDAWRLLFKRWLPQAGRTANRNQREKIWQRLKSKECRQPIYLKLLFEEARLWRSYDAAPGLGEGVSALLGQLIERLCQPANHGQLLVERVLGYLAASRHGLAENEILEVLFADLEYKAALDQATKQTRHELPASATRIPIAIWSRLRFDLAPYLIERAAVGANVLTFYHRQVVEWVQEHFEKSSDQRWQPHPRLANYFENQDWWSESMGDQERLKGYLSQELPLANCRKAFELAWQWFAAGRTNETEKILCSFDWLYAAMVSCGIRFVIGDLNLIPTSSRVATLRQVIERSAPALEEDVTQLSGQLIARLTYDLAFEELLEEAKTRCFTPWLRPLAGGLRQHNKALLWTLEMSSGNTISHLAVSSDGRVAVSSAYKYFDVWDLEIGRRSFTVTNHDWNSVPVPGSDSDRIHALTIGRSRDTAVSASWQTIKVWDLKTGREMHSHRHKEPFICISRVAVTSDGAAVFFAWVTDSWSKKMEVAVWHVGSDTSEVLFRCDHYEVVALQLDEPRKLVIGASRSRIFIWDISTRSECRQIDLSKTDCQCLAITPDGTTAISAGKSQCVLVWDLTEGKIRFQMEGHNCGIAALAVSPDSMTAVGWSPDGSICLWNLQQGTRLAIYSGILPKLQTLALPSSTRLVTASGTTGNVSIEAWDLEIASQPQTVPGHLNTINAIGISADSKFAVSASNDKTLKVWDVAKGLELRTLVGHSDVVWDVAVSADGKIAVSASWDETFRVWELSTGKTIHTFNTQGIAHAVQLLPHNNAVLSKGQYDYGLRCWDWATGQELSFIREPTLIDQFAVTSTGDIAVSASQHAWTAEVWNVRSGQVLCQLRGNNCGIASLALGGDHIVVTSFYDRTIKVWDLYSGKEIYTLAGRQGGAGSVAVTPDGRTAVCATWDRIVKVWDVETGRPVAAFTGESSFRSCAIAPDGKTVVAGEESGRIHFLTLVNYDSQRKVQ